MQARNVFIVVLAAIGCLGMARNAAAQATSGVSGQCTWTLTGPSTNLTLTISPGSSGGEMADHSRLSTPWYGFLENIKNLVINEGVTGIGKYAFHDCAYITGAAP